MRNKSKILAQNINHFLIIIFRAEQTIHDGGSGILLQALENKPKKLNLKVWFSQLKILPLLLDIVALTIIDYRD